MRRVRVQWENPVGLDVVLKLSGDNDYGPYQIDSHHVVFGPSALVYIGMAAEQTFGVRFKQHEAYWLSEENDVEIRVGRLWPDDYVKDRGGRDWKQLLSDTEALLVHWHSPPYNTQHIIDYTGQALHVQNWGNRGSILPECTSEWDAPRPRDD